MSRRVFFSFHYQQDIWRVSQIRNSWLLSGEANTFLDAASWESIKRRGPSGIRTWINRQLNGTGVTVVLIGEHTAARRYVKYEIRQSFERGNGLLAIYIHGLRDSNGRPSRRGRNPLDNFVTEVDEPELFFFVARKSKRKLSSIFETYDWVQDNGRRNMSKWIEEAARRAGR